MDKKSLELEARRFRKAIEIARDVGEFNSSTYRKERMSEFPDDCCDDTADLFTHYLFSKFGVSSIRVDGQYYDSRWKCLCGHSWQETEGFIVDLTGDQFSNDPAICIKGKSVYVGKMDAFHKQFEICAKWHSCGIQSLSSTSWERMNGLYDRIVKYMKY